MGKTVGHLTVAEFRALPDRPGVRMELHDGEVFEKTYPKKRHSHIQNRLLRLLAPALDPRVSWPSNLRFDQNRSINSGRRTSPSSHRSAGMRRRSTTI